MTRQDNQELARQRASVIFKVRSGQMTVRQAARQLGISRKAYYEWEQRGLAALSEALENHESGRPASVVDEEKEALKHRVGELEKELYLARKTVEVRDLLDVYHKQAGPGGKKNQRTGKER
jgi:transposase